MTALDLSTQPANSLEAEQVVLGSLLMAPLAGDVSTVIGPGDFYDPRHGTIFEAICTLDDDAKPVATASVITALRDNGTLAQVGGPEYIVRLGGYAAPATTMYYAEIIKEKAGKRRLMNLHMTGMRNAQDGIGGDLKALVAETQAALDALTDETLTSEVTRAGETLGFTMDRIEERGKNAGQVTGVPTGFRDLDDKLGGLHPGQMVVVAARPAVGKALALGTALPTPTGWTTMGEVQVGDLLLDRFGQPTRVVAATEVMTGRPCFEVVFSDGERVIADAQHQWLTQTRATRRNRNDPTVVTTEQIAATLKVAGDMRANHSVPVAAPVRGSEREDLPVAPYTLGAWLGDGSAAGNRLTSATDEIPSLVRQDGYLVRSLGGYAYSILLPVEPSPSPQPCPVCGTPFIPKTANVRTCGRSCGSGNRRTGRRPDAACPDCGESYAGGRRCEACHSDHGTFTALLRKVGVLENKHIPAVYLRASIDQRRALLAGLLDTDGSVCQSGSVEIALTDKALVDTVHELIVSLGYRCTISQKSVLGRAPKSSICYMLRFSTNDEVFRLERKRKAHRERMNNRRAAAGSHASRYIVDVRPIESVPVRCVEVDNEEHLYLAGRAMIPTHNSTLGLDFARHAALKHNIPAVIFSLEMGKDEINLRLLSAEARVDLSHLKSGEVSPTEWDRIAKRTESIQNAPLFIDDDAAATMSQIRTRARRLKQRHGLGLIVIDYLQLMSSGKRVESRQQEVSEFSRQIKLLAKELEVPIVAMSQLNRGPENRSGDQRPKMSDLRESGAIEQDADVVMLIHRDELTNPESVRVGEADIIVAKQRSGPTGTVVLAAQLHLSRFADFSGAEPPGGF